MPHDLPTLFEQNHPLARRVEGHALIWLGSDLIRFYVFVLQRAVVARESHEYWLEGSEGFVPYTDYPEPKP